MRKAINISIVTLFFVSMMIMLLSVILVGCNTQKRIAKKEAKAEKEKYVNCIVTARRFKDCKIWLNCGGKNTAIFDCSMVKTVKKLDVIQLERKQ